MTYEIQNMFFPDEPEDHLSSPEQILSFIENRPGSTVNDVMGHMKSTRKAAKAAVRRLEEAGRIHRISKEGATRIRFVVGPKPKPIAKRQANRDHPKQILTDSWTPPPVSPQSWLSALEWKPGGK